MLGNSDKLYFFIKFQSKYVGIYMQYNIIVS